MCGIIQMPHSHLGRLLVGLRLRLSDKVGQARLLACFVARQFIACDGRQVDSVNISIGHRLRRLLRLALEHAIAPCAVAGRALASLTLALALCTLALGLLALFALALFALGALALGALALLALLALGL